MKEIFLTGRKKRHRKIRVKISGTSKRPRVSIFRSNKYISSQAIDDENGKTLASINTKKVDGANQIERSKVAGKKLAEKLIASGLKEGVFDRGGYLYAGRIRAFADGLREGGLNI